MIKKVKGGFKAFDSTGKRALSKKPKSRKAAYKQVQAVEYSKAHRGSRRGK